MQHNRKTEFPKLIKIGYCDDFPIELPLYLSSALMFETNDANRRQINTQLQLIVLNLLKTIDKNCVRITIVDFSLEFEYLNTLKSNNEVLQFVHKPAELKNVLQTLEETKIHLLKNVLKPGQSLDEYNQTAKFAEPYHYVVMNDFIKNVGDDDLHSIIRIAENAQKHNIYFLLTFSPETINKRLSVNYNNRFAELLDFFVHQVIVLRQNAQAIYEILNVPNIELINKLMHRFKFENFNSEKVISDVRQINKYLENTFADDRENFLSIPIGYSGRNPVYFELGEKATVFNALISGMTRMGKSNLLNNIITQIAEKYTANQIQLFLLDYKQGTEFKIFKTHPNVNTLLLNNSDYYCAVDILGYFYNQMSVREKLFGDTINKIEEYNEKKSPGIPRLILVIDEVQTIFKTNDWDLKKNFNTLLSEIARKGAAYGLHLIFSSQTFAGIDWSPDIKAQMPLRISFRLASNSDVAAIFDGNYSNPTLKLPPYSAIYNTNCGEPESNQIVRLDECKRDEILERLTKARNSKKQNDCIKANIITEENTKSSKKNEKNKQNKQKNDNFTEDPNASWDNIWDDLK